MDKYKFIFAIFVTIFFAIIVWGAINVVFFGW